jgi:hypothetical protein
MPEIRFRVIFAGTPATADDLLHIDEIAVEQTEDSAWEARITMALCLDENGQWARQNDLRLAPRTQVRVELKIGTADYKPLIEGPIITVDTAMDSRPGRSTATIVIHDDSAWLNMESSVTPRTGLTDADLARELFAELPNFASVPPPEPRVTLPTSSTPDSLGPQFAQLGTAMQKLRYLATRNGCRVYVVPGETRGQSIGYMQEDPSPSATPTLPTLVLLGAGRNLLDVTATQDPGITSNTSVHTLRLGDQQVQSYTTQDSDRTLLGPQPAAVTPPTRPLAPGAIDTEDPNARAIAERRLRDFPVKYNGRLIPGAYPAILQPFQLVDLFAGSAQISTRLVITKATHRITPSLYSVEFEGRGNSVANLEATAGLPSSIV